jgi:hypothetical protein
MYFVYFDNVYNVVMQQFRTCQAYAGAIGLGRCRNWHPDTPGYTSV